MAEQRRFVWRVSFQVRVDFERKAGFWFHPEQKHVVAGEDGWEAFNLIRGAEIGREFEDDDQGHGKAVAVRLLVLDQFTHVDMDSLQHERDGLRAAEAVVKETLVQIFAAAIAGLSDAAIVKQATYDFTHVAAAVAQLGEYTKALKAERDTLRAHLQDHIDLDPSKRRQEP